MCKYLLKNNFLSATINIYLRYGFRRIVSEDNADVNCYYHPLFLRGRSDLCAAINSVKKRCLVDKENEPDLSAFPPLPLSDDGEVANGDVSSTSNQKPAINGSAVVRQLAFCNCPRNGFCSCAPNDYIPNEKDFKIEEEEDDEKTMNEINGKRRKKQKTESNQKPMPSFSNSNSSSLLLYAPFEKGVDHNENDFENDKKILCDEILSTPKQQESVNNMSSSSISCSGSAEHCFEEYFDYQNVLDEEANETMSSGQKRLFPAKLHKLLSQSEEENYSHIISWLPHGRAFKIHDEKEFIEKVACRFFRVTNMANFKQQLSYYGFQKVVSNILDVDAYFHER